MGLGSDGANVLAATGAVFGPEQLTVIGRAFDGAWQQLEVHCQIGAHREQARVRLATLVLALAPRLLHDPMQLKDRAVRVLARDYAN